LVHRPYDPPTTKFRLREARQAEKEDRSSNEKESKMIAERKLHGRWNLEQMIRSERAFNKRAPL